MTNNTLISQAYNYLKNNRGAAKEMGMESVAEMDRGKAKEYLETNPQDLNKIIDHFHREDSPLEESVRTYPQNEGNSTLEQEVVNYVSQKWTDFKQSRISGAAEKFGFLAAYGTSLAARVNEEATSFSGQLGPLAQTIIPISAEILSDWKISRYEKGDGSLATTKAMEYGATVLELGIAAMSALAIAYKTPPVQFALQSWAPEARETLDMVYEGMYGSQDALVPLFFGAANLYAARTETK